MRTRPAANGSYASSPASAATIELLGYAFRHKSVAITRDEYRHLAKLYGYVPEPTGTRPTKPVPPEPKALMEGAPGVRQGLEGMEKWKDPREFFQAGADKNLMRHADEDGFRIIAWLARFVDAGTDPLKTVVQIDAGWNVDPVDVEWANGDSND